MEQVNYEFLCNDLKFLGFGESLHSELREMLQTEHDSFELHFKNKIGDEPVEAILYFSRPDPTGFFFFTKYLVTVAGKSQVFFIFKGKGITFKEGFNLLNGRAVFKQRTARNGQKYNEWLELDLTTIDDHGYRPIVYPESQGFELSEVLNAMLIETPTANWDRSMLIRSLEKGNLQAAFIRQDGANRKVYIRANPRERTITIHDIETAPWAQSKLSLGDDIEDALKRKPTRAKKIKDINF